MSEQLEKEVEELKCLIVGLQQPKSEPTIVESSGKLFKWVQSIVAVVTVVVGLGINWGITTTKLDVLEAKITAIESVIFARVDKLDSDVHELQLKQARDDQLLQTMQGDISEIKADVKALVERRPR